MLGLILLRVDPPPREIFDHEAGKENPGARFLRPGLIETVDRIQQVAACFDVVAGDEDASQVVVGRWLECSQQLFGTDLQELSNTFLQHHGVPPTKSSYINI